MNTTNFISRAFPALLAFVLLSSPGFVRGDAYDTLRLKWRDLLTGGTNFSLAVTEISNKVVSVNSAGNSQWTNMVKTGGLNRAYLWSDLASTNNSSDVTTCYSRLLTMATAWATKGAVLQNNTNLVTDIIGGLDWMYAKRYHTNYPSNTPYDNWWDWEVGAPQALNDVVVLVYSNLTAMQISQYMGAVDFFTPVPAYTAANRTYTARVVALRGVIGKNSAKLASTRDGLDIVFPYTGDEGFRKEGSFIQHDAFPYTGGYGEALLNDLGRVIYLLESSTWAVTNSQRTNLYNWVYEAYQPLIYKGACMDMQRGRSVSRGGGEDHGTGHNLIHDIIRLTLFAPTNAPTNHALAYKQMVKYWIQSDTYRNVVTAAPTLNQLLLARNIRDDTNITASSEMVAHRTFPEMDRVVHLRPGWGIGLAMFSDRIYNYESINGENLHGWHTSDGMVYVYNTDLSHYAAGFWPTVNPKRIPGTTVDTLALTNGAYEGLYSTKNWVGGANILGTYGAAGMNYASVFSSLTAKKSWFMFSNEVVAIGTAITSTNNRAIETTVENRKLNATGNNAFTVNGTAQSTSLGWSATLTNVNWAHLTGNSNGADVGYYFPTATTLKAVREHRTNSWANIGGSSSTILSNRFLTLWRDHGTNPANASYAYVLLPNKTSTQVSNYAAAPNITIVAQTTNVHAARDNSLNLLAANFWENGTNTVDLLTSQQMASVLVKENPGTLEIAVSDPTQDNGTVRRLRTQDDSYVYDGSTNSNYGSASSLILKTATAGYNRQGYVKFFLANAGLTNITNATLNIFVSTLQNGPTAIGLYQTTDSWAENTITWPNRPAAGTLISSVTASNTNAWISFNVTSFVNSQLAGDKVASFVLISGTTNNYVTLETGESFNAPQLDLAGAPSSGFIDLELARSAASTISNDPRVSVTQLTPTIKLRVNVSCYPQNAATNNGVRGATWRAKFALDTNAPSVTVTNPAGGAYVRGTSVAVGASASDNVGVVGVQFKLDGANLGSEDTASPYSTTWNTTGASNGLHSLTAVARDAAGNTKTSTVVSVTVDNTAPTGVAVTNPIAGARVTGTITVSGTASDNIGVAGVQFKLAGGNLGAEDTSPPFSVSWNTTAASDGNHTLTATARDAAGNTTTSTGITVTVDNTGPSTTVTNPVVGAVVRGAAVTLGASASDGAGVAGVQFKVDGGNVNGEDASAPYQTTWNTTGYSDGVHTITAVGRDTLNNTATSPGVAVTVDNTPPTVSVTGPLHGQTVNGFLTLLAATANDAISLAGVQFRVNGANQGAEDTTPPYQLAWNTLNLSGGIYGLSAVARDFAGNLTTSAEVSVTVTNPIQQASGGAGWLNASVDAQAAAFNFEFDASPSLNPMDGVIGLSSGAATGYSNLACIVRFNTSGFIDARNGGVYAASNSIPYSAGANHHFRLGVNVTNHTYTIHVTPEGGAEQLLGSNFAFRTEQNAVAVVDNFSVVTVTTNATLKAWNALALDTALVSWHRLDETFGLTAFDSSKNGHQGTLNEAIWTNGAVDLDGVNDSVQLPQNQWNFTNGLTLSLWLYSATAKSWESFFNFGNTNGSQNIMLYRDSTNSHVKFAIYNGTNISALLVSNVLALTQWQHFAVTVGPLGGAALYTNGVLAKTGSSVFAVPTVLRTNNFFGKNSGTGGYHDGGIDEVRIYNRTFGSNEVLRLP